MSDFGRQLIGIRCGAGIGVGSTFHLTGNHLSDLIDKLALVGPADSLQPEECRENRALVAVEGPVLIDDHFPKNCGGAAFDLRDEVLYSVGVGAGVDVVKVPKYRRISGGLLKLLLAAESYDAELVVIIGERVQVELGDSVMTALNLSHLLRLREHRSTDG